MKKVKLFLAMLLLSSFASFAQSINIPMTPDEPTVPDKEEVRSLGVSPTALLEESTLTIRYPMSTTSQVIIRDTETGAVVYSAPYDATRQVVINLSSLSEGTYEIRLYAFGKWWWGEFELGE